MQRLLPVFLIGFFFFALLQIWMNAQSYQWGLFAIAIALGFILLRSEFGFAVSYRKFLTHHLVTGLMAQVVMLLVASLAFYPMLLEGRNGALAPVDISLLVGSALLGVGMQLSNACASGALFNIGRLNIRMCIVLAAFVAGAFWGSLDVFWWRDLPSMGSVSLLKTLGYDLGLAVQLLILAGLLMGFAVWKKDQARSLVSGWHWGMLTTGVWPLLWGAILLALLNALVFQIAGHPWSVTWGFTLWGGKIVQALGWDLSGIDFWQIGFTSRALENSIFQDTVSVMNLGIIFGAALAVLTGVKRSTDFHWSWGPILSALLGGLAMGYGARLAGGCNIGAMFSGIASFSLHGWVWLLTALGASFIGIKLRPLFGLDRV